MQTQTFAKTVVLVVETCISCGVTFGLESEFQKQRKRDHGTWYCSNGHSMMYPGESDEERLKRELKAERDHAAALRAERDQIDASRRAFKGQATRLRNRAIAGDCPLCGKHVYQLERHMGRVHPTEQPEVEE